VHKPRDTLRIELATGRASVPALLGALVQHIAFGAFRSRVILVLVEFCPALQHRQSVLAQDLALRVGQHPVLILVGPFIREDRIARDHEPVAAMLLCFSARTPSLTLVVRLIAFVLSVHVRWRKILCFEFFDGNTVDVPALAVRILLAFLSALGPRTLFVLVQLRARLTLPLQIEIIGVRSLPDVCDAVVSVGFVVGQLGVAAEHNAVAFVCLHLAATLPSLTFISFELRVGQAKLERRVELWLAELFHDDSVDVKARALFVRNADLRALVPATLLVFV